MKCLVFFTSLILIHTVCGQLSTPGYGIGNIQPNQELLQVITKFTPIHDEVQNKIELDFNYNGEGVIDKITYAAYTMQLDSFVTGIELYEGGENQTLISTKLWCENCRFMTITQKVYGFYKTENPTTPDPPAP